MKVDYTKFEYVGRNLYAWFGTITVNTNGTSKEISVCIYDDSDNRGVLPQAGKDALEFFIDNYDKYKEAILEAVYDYYDYRKSAWGGDDPDEPMYPDANSAEEVYAMMTLSSMIIGYNYNPGQHDIHFVYNSKFDSELGVGICMTNLNVDEIGIQGIAV